MVSPMMAIVLRSGWGCRLWSDEGSAMVRTDEDKFQQLNWNAGSPRVKPLDVKKKTVNFFWESQVTTYWCTKYLQCWMLNTYFFDVELLCFWVGPVDLEPNTSRRIWYMMWCCDALSCVTTSLAASGQIFRSCMPNGGISFTHTPRSWEWHATEFDVMIPKKGGYGPVTCIFGVWDAVCPMSEPKSYQPSVTTPQHLSICCSSIPSSPGRCQWW
jgi:hypothetical protein